MELHEVIAANAQAQGNLGAMAERIGLAEGTVRQSVEALSTVAMKARSDTHQLSALTSTITQAFRPSLERQKQFSDVLGAHRVTGLSLQQATAAIGALVPPRPLLPAARIPPEPRAWSVPHEPRDIESIELQPAQSQRADWGQRAFWATVGGILVAILIDLSHRII